MSRLSRTDRNIESLTMGCTEDSRTDLDAQTWLREQLEHKAQAAQWLSEAPGPWCQGVWRAADVQHISLCWDCSPCFLKECKAIVQRAVQLALSCQSQCQAARGRKWGDSLCAHCACVNKTIKLCHLALQKKMVGHLANYYECKIFVSKNIRLSIHLLFCNWRKMMYQYFNVILYRLNLKSQKYLDYINCSRNEDFGLILYNLKLLLLKYLKSQLSSLIFE